MINDNPPEPDAEPEEKPKARGWATATPEQRAAYKIKADETRARKKEGAQTIRMEAPEPRIAPKQPKGKAPKRELTTLDKQVLVDALRMANVALDLTSKPDERWMDGPMKGQSVYSLSVEEVNSLADAWFEVAKRYSVFGSFLVAGRSLSVWGQALFVSYVVVGRRAQIAAELRNRRLGQSGVPGGAGAGPIGTPGGNDGLRKDDASAAAPLVD